MIEVRALEELNKKYKASDSFNVDIIPGMAFRIFGSKSDKLFNKMFEIGARVNSTGYKEAPSQGNISAITEKTVTISRDDGSIARFRYYNFIWKNG